MLCLKTIYAIIEDMKSKLKIIFLTVILLIIAIGGFFVFNNKNAPIKFENQLSIPAKIDTLNTKVTSTLSKLIPPIRVPILVYHSIRPSYVGEPNANKIYDVHPNNFEKQLKYLKAQGYTTISFEDLTNYFDGKSLPTKPVIISLDDGLETQFTNAVPILNKEGMTATFFIYTNAIGRPKFFTWDQVRELSKFNMEIGGHSKSHPYLWKITDTTKLKIEIVESKKIIEEQIGKTITAFAYPFGLHKPITISEIKEAGYTSARIGFERTTHTKDDLYTLHSFMVTNDMKRFYAVINNQK